MRVKRIVLLALLSSILAISSLITIPSWFLVPFTLQTLTVSLIGLLLLPSEAFLVVLVYLFVGGIGLPVFSNFQAGFGHFVSPTGGFLISFPFAAMLISFFKKNERHIYNLIIVNTIMIVFVYIIGVTHFIIITTNDLTSTLLLFVPFVFIDIFKNFISYYLYLKINPLIIKQFS